MWLTNKPGERGSRQGCEILRTNPSVLPVPPPRMLTRSSLQLPFSGPSGSAASGDASNPPIGSGDPSESPHLMGSPVKHINRWRDSRKEGQTRQAGSRPDSVACRWKVGVTFSSKDSVDPCSMQAPPIPLRRMLWNISKDFGWRKR